MFIDFDQLVRVYGGLAVFLGAALEGEAAVTTGGYLAHRGMIDPIVAGSCAFAGSLTADQIIFFLARYHRDGRLVTKVRQRPAFAKAIRFIENRPRVFCLAFRFIYGMRSAGPIAIGISRVPTRQFVMLNIISAAIWASIFTFIGFRFGRAFEALIVRIISDPWAIALAGLVIAGGIAFLIRRHFRIGAASVPPPSTP